MIRPTVGRVVLVHRFNPDLTPVSDQPEPALVSYVHSDSLINVGGVDANGKPFAITSLRLLQYDDEVGHPVGDAYAEWMPYQKMKAAEEAAAEGPAPAPAQEEAPASDAPDSDQEAE